MKIQRGAVDRHEQFKDIAEQCFRSRSTRVARYARNKQYYLYGTTDQQPVTMNKIAPHVELVQSYLFSAETTRFAIELGESAPKTELLKIDPLQNRVQEEWHDSNADMNYKEGLKWALVWDSMFLQLRWKRGGIVPYLIPPHNVGVWREDVTEIGRQEAVCVRYQTTLDELRWRLQAHPQSERILASLTAGPASQDEPQYPQVVRDIVLAQMNPIQTGQNMQGVVDVTAPPTDSFVPMLPDKMITLTDAWIFDDDIEDWRWVTMTDTAGICIYDREWRESFLEHELGMVQIRPRPYLGYFWGESETTCLIPLQDAMSKRLEDVRHLMNKQVRPSYAGFGMTFDPAEFRTAMDSEYGYINGGESNGKMQELAPQMPPDIFKEMEYFEHLFDEVSGIAGVVKGQSQPGVRSRGQTDTLAKLGSVRLKNRSMTSEDELGQIATIMLKLIQREDERRLHYVSADTQQRTPFIAKQFDADHVVKVDSHSMSPVFADDNKQLAQQMLEDKIITRERFVDLIQPPQRQQIKAELAVIQQQEQAAQQAEAAKEQQGKPELKAVK